MGKSQQLWLPELALDHYAFSALLVLKTTDAWIFNVSGWPS